MMSKSIDFYYDYVSPNSYLAWTQLTKLCAETGTRLNYKPILLGGVFKATGNSSPILVASKAAWLKEDILRHVKYYDVPFAFNPFFPLSTTIIMRGSMWALTTENIKEYNKVMFEAVWVDQKNMADQNVITEVLESNGFDAKQVIKATEQQVFKKALIQSTEEAVARGVFGAPTMFIDGQMHFGQDRLDWVKRTIGN
jgi:2-hydroxychromene-2-carboxylate isomerase